MRVLAAARVPRQATTGGSSNNSVSTRYCGLHAKLARARPNRNIAEIRGVCKKPAASIISGGARFPRMSTPVRQINYRLETSIPDGRFFKTDLRSGFTGRSERPRVMLRRHWATSRLMEPPHGGDGGDDDVYDGGDERSAMPRHWATLHPSVQQGMLRVSPPSPGSARVPAPPALQRTAPQSTGKQYASYPSPSPSRFLDGDFTSRLTFT